MINKHPLPLVSLIVLLCLTGCSFKGGYNPSYLPNQPLPLNVAGKGLVVISVDEERRSFSEKPTSFTGSATTLTLPLGEISKQIALKVFGAAFSEGVDFRNEAGDTKGYRVVVKPRVANLSYAYNQLKNLGFALTPHTTVELEIRAVAPDGREILTKTYQSGLVDGDTYVVSGQPHEKVNKLIHLTIFKLMSDAAKELKSSMEADAVAGVAPTAPVLGLRT